MAPRAFDLLVYILETHQSFSVKIKRSDNLDKLRQVILKRRSDELGGVVDDQLLLYKVNNFCDGEDIKQRAPLAQKDKVMRADVKISELFPNSNPPTTMVSIFVKILSPAIVAGPLVDGWLHKSRSSNLKPYITFVAPGRGNFGHLFNLSDNHISRSENSPDFVTTLLSQKRRHNISGVEILQNYLSEMTFKEYFTDGPGEQVYNDEHRSYLAVFESPAKGKLAERAFDFGGEAYAHYFLMALAINCDQYLGDVVSSYSFGKSWQFPLIAKVLDGATAGEYSYKPRSDFFLSFKDIPIVLLDVCSDRTAAVMSECDRPRLLLQAACVVRLLNHLTGISNVLLAAYIDGHLTATCYYLFEAKDSSLGAHVEYYKPETFDLRSPLEGFKFLFRIYNFVSYMKTRIGQIRFKRAIGTLWTDNLKDLPPFTSRDSNNSKRQNGDSGGKCGQGGAKRQRRGNRTLNQPTISDALAEKGYHVQPEEEEIEGWTPRHPLKPTLSRAESEDGPVMLKLLDEDSRELEILEFLNGIKSDDNYVITLFRSFHLDIGTVIALPIASRLDCRDFTTPAIALDLMDQLVRAVGFIHANGVAHLDLKPSNILVSCTDDHPRLVVIDFGVSVFVDSPETKIEGFVGTRGYVAPEVGTEDGPRQRYSAIRADLWACGQLLSYMASQSRVRQLSTRMIQLARALSSDDPLQRPSLIKGRGKSG